MNKKFPWALILLMSLFLSCHDDAPSLKELIEGSWMPSTYSMTGCLDGQYNEPEIPAGGPNYTFSSDKWTYTIPAYTVTTGPGCSHNYCPPYTIPARIISGSYSLEGRTMHFEYDDGTPGVTYLVIANSSTLTLSEEVMYYYTAGCWRNHNFIRQ